MKKSGITDLPLHGGRCPPWLFKKMKLLGEAIVSVIVHEYGREEFLRRIGDPFFFQALGCALGFDWHSSGLTTTVCGALKEAVDPSELGIAVCGGKGRASKRTQEEISQVSNIFSLSSGKIEELQYASRMAAKVDNACIQDGYQLYHHTFFLSEDGRWAVVQQGMHGTLARRYHWISSGIQSFVDEPHSGIVSDRRREEVLNMTAQESEEARKASVDAVRDNPDQLQLYLQEAKQRSLDEYVGTSPRRLVMPASHSITPLSKETLNALKKANEIQPESYEELVAIRGVGPKAVRALALVSELIYGAPPSWKDPAKFTFAHGGKDGVPYPVDRLTYEKTIEILDSAIRNAKIGKREQLHAIRRLSDFMKF